jgi:predicted dehydrogenase
MSQRTVKFGLIGFGAWGQHHAQAIVGTPGATLAGIVAPSEVSRAAATAAHPGVPVFADHRALLSSVRPDIVDVVTPSHTHLEITRDALAAGCDVLLEKPMAVTLEDCREIARLARASGRRVAVGHEFRLSSQWGTIKDLIAAGRIGDPQYVLVELSRRPYRLGASGWRYDPQRVGSWVLEEPIHFFDLARGIWPAPVTQLNFTPEATRAIPPGRISTTISARCSPTRTARTPSFRKRSRRLSTTRRSRSLAPAGQSGPAGAGRLIERWNRPAF